MRTVEVFKTNVSEAPAAEQLIALLLSHFPDSRINFDLDDCDKVLRIEGKGLDAGTVMSVVSGKGFECSFLD